mgnify:CR=1 FL=1
MQKYLDNDTEKIINELIKINDEEKLVGDELYMATAAKNAVAVDFILNKVNFLSTLDAAIIIPIAGNDIVIVEMILKKISYLVTPSVNCCLDVVHVETLRFLLSHNVAYFTPGAEHSLYVRNAVMKKDYERVHTFLFSPNSNNNSINLLAKDADTTLGRSCVELAYFNKDDKMLKLFINSGLTYYSALRLSPEIQKHLRILENEICYSKFTNRRILLKNYKRRRISPNVKQEVYDLAFPRYVGDEYMQRRKAKIMCESFSNN